MVQRDEDRFINLHHLESLSHDSTPITDLIHHISLSTLYTTLQFNKMSKQAGLSVVYSRRSQNI